MEKDEQFARISFEIDPEHLREITSSGRLEEFVEAATEIFRRDLKTESNNKEILIAREDWPTRKKGGYTLKFLVMNADAVEMGGSA